MMNKQLADYLDVPEEDRERIQALQDMLGILLDVYRERVEENGPPPKKIRKALRRHVQVMEFMLQRLWGFHEDKWKHTWCHHFPGLIGKKERAQWAHLAAANEMAVEELLNTVTAD